MPETCTMTDAELLAQFASTRCEGALRALVDRHLNLVYSAALRQVRDPGIAQDIAQGVFIALAAKAPALAAKRVLLPAWLMGVTRYAACKTLRQRKARAQFEQKGAVMKTQTLSAVDSESLGHLLDEALNRLAPPDRTAIALYYLENRSLRDVGNALAVSERAAQKRVSRALLRLRKIMQRRGVECSDDALQASLHSYASAVVSPALVDAVVNSILHPLTATAGGSTVARQIIEFQSAKKAAALAIAAAVIATLAVPSIPFIYHAMSTGPKTTAPIFTAATDNDLNYSPITGMHAVNYRVIDLTPDGVGGIRAWAISGNQISGTAIEGGGPLWAVLWTGAGSETINLNPAGYSLTHVRGANGTRQVGMGHNPTDGKMHALLWNSSATDFVDLNPSGFDSSGAYGIWGNREAGFGSGTATGGHEHALLWSGTPASEVDLNPPGFVRSSAFDIYENHEVGQGLSSSDNRLHALLWSGTAASAVNLTPRLFAYATAFGIFGNQIVGYSGGPPGDWGGAPQGDADHALLWTGANQNVIDLNPAGFMISYAVATNGVQQVGTGCTIAGRGQSCHALVWTSSADSAIDLHKFLPEGFINSYAWAINSDGDIVGWAEGKKVPTAHAIEWIPIGPMVKNTAASAPNAETDKRNLCLYNEGEIVSQSLGYAMHNDQHLFPQSLGELIVKGPLLPENLVDPSSDTTPLVIPAEHVQDAAWIDAHLAGHCDYVYTGAGLDFQKLEAANQLATTVIVYESLPVHKGQTALFGYADNHLVWLSPGEFNKATAWPTSP